MQITTTKTVEEKVTIQLPAFFKKDNDAVAIFSEDENINISRSMYGTFTCIIANGSVPDVKEWEGCTEQEFRTAFENATTDMIASYEYLQKQKAA